MKMKNMRIVSLKTVTQQSDTGYSPENDDGSSEIVASPGRITQEMRDEPVLSDREMDSSSNR